MLSVSWVAFGVSVVVIVVTAVHGHAHAGTRWPSKRALRLRLVLHGVLAAAVTVGVLSFAAAVIPTT